MVLSISHTLKICVVFLQKYRGFVLPKTLQYMVLNDVSAINIRYAFVRFSILRSWNSSERGFGHLCGEKTLSGQKQGYSFQIIYGNLLLRARSTSDSSQSYDTALCQELFPKCLSKQNRQLLNKSPFPSSSRSWCMFSHRTEMSTYKTDFYPFRWQRSGSRSNVGLF